MMGPKRMKKARHLTGPFRNEADPPSSPRDFGGQAGFRFAGAFGGHADPHRDESPKCTKAGQEGQPLCKRGRRESNPQPPDRQSGALTN